MTVMQPRTAFAPLPPEAAASVRRPLAVDASLTFRQRGGRTFLGSQLTPHPFHITRPFYRPDDPAGMATLYLQSSSGGLYGDDALDLRIVAEAGARAHVTSQASTMVPASLGGAARLGVHLRCDAGAALEYVPDPLILFDGADAETTLDVSMAPDARAIVADAILLHDPLGGVPTSGRWANTITVSVDGDPLPRLIERQRLDLGDPLAFGLLQGDGPRAKALCYGALYCIGLDTATAAEAFRRSSRHSAGPARRRANRAGSIGASILCRRRASSARDSSAATARR